MKDTTINIRLNAELKKHLEAIAQINDMNMSETIRAILKENLEAENIANLKLISLERKAYKVRDILSNSNSMYLVGKNSEVEIQFKDFDVEAFSMPSSDALSSDVVLSVGLYENYEKNEKVAQLIFNDEIKIETRKDHRGESLVVTNL